MDEYAAPDGVCAQRQYAKYRSCHDCAEGLCRRLLKMDHAIGNHHHDDCHGSYSVFHRMNHEASEEELEREELQTIEEFPDGEVPDGQRVMVERVRLLESLGI